jgi:hypothetical protein
VRAADSALCALQGEDVAFPFTYPRTFNAAIQRADATREPGVLPILGLNAAPARSKLAQVAFPNAGGRP